MTCRFNVTLFSQPTKRTQSKELCIHSFNLQFLKWLNFCLLVICLYQKHIFRFFFLPAVQQTRAQDFERNRRRARRNQVKGEIRKETDFASLTDFVFHLQAVEPYRPPQREEARSNVDQNTTRRAIDGGVTKSPSESTTETAARLIFMTVHWAKKVKHFTELSHLDQVTLLRENWCKIFIINLVQWAMPFEMAPLVTEIVEKTAPEHLESALHSIGKLNEVVFTLVQLQLKSAEFSLLKSLALFNPGRFFLFS